MRGCSHAYFVDKFLAFLITYSTTFTFSTLEKKAIFLDYLPFLLVNANAPLYWLNHILARMTLWPGTLWPGHFGQSDLLAKDNLARDSLAGETVWPVSLWLVTLWPVTLWPE